LEKNIYIHKKEEITLYNNIGRVTFITFVKNTCWIVKTHQ